MKYNLNIQLEEMHSLCPEMDIVDAFVLDYTKDWFGSTSQKVKRKIIDDRMWVWIDLDTVLSSIPFIGISEKSGVSKRLSRLEKFGLLEKKKIGNDLYISLTIKVDLLYNSNKRASVDEIQRLARSANDALSDAPQPLTQINGSVDVDQRSLYRTQEYNSSPYIPQGNLEDGNEFPEKKEKSGNGLPDIQPLPNYPGTENMPTHVVPSSYPDRDSFEREILKMMQANLPHIVDRIPDFVLKRWGEIIEPPPQLNDGLNRGDPAALERMKESNPQLYEKIKQTIP